MFVLYEVLLYLVFIITLPFFLITGVLRGKYLSNFPARLGFFRSRRSPHDLWIHAVSVGETLAARPVVEAIMRQRPETSVVFTTTTLTGQAQARRTYPGATVTYFPFDFAFSVRRFLDHHQPKVFATMETEIWPNVTRLTRARGIPLVLANGRISDRSFPRYRALKLLVAPIVRKYSRILAREQTDRERFIAIGAQPEAVEISGNVKFDYEPDETPLEIHDLLTRLIGGRKVFVMGSTAEGEDERLLPEVERFMNEENAFIIIAPRKPERFDIVSALLETMSFRFVRRSELDLGAGVILSRKDGEESPESGDPSASSRLRMTPVPTYDVLLLDSFGELAKIYRYATAAFIGGSLVPVGGHNPIEAAAAGVPVSFGPSMSNFREIAAAFIQAEAAEEVADAAAVTEFARRMFRDDALRQARAERARRTVLQNRGASARTAQRIVEFLE